MMPESYLFVRNILQSDIKVEKIVEEIDFEKLKKMGH